MDSFYQPKTRRDPLLTRTVVGDRLDEDTSTYKEGEEMDIQETLSRALSAVEEAKLPDDLRVAGFQYAIRALSESAVSSIPGTGLPKTSNEKDTGNEPPNLLISRVNQYGVDLDVLNETYTASDGEITLTIAKSQLPSQIKAGLQSIALVLCFIRQGMSMEEFTSQEEIGRVADGYGVKDSNFSRNMQSISPWFQVKPENGKRYYRLRRAGWEEAAKIINGFGETQS